MSKLELANKSQEPYYIVEIKDESKESTEFEFNNLEHNYCINDYSARPNKQLIYFNETNEPNQLETLENVEPNLVLLTYGNELPSVVGGIQDEDGNTIQLYDGNNLVQDVFVHNGEVELVNAEVPEVATIEETQDQEGAEQVEENIDANADLVHKVNGTEVWIMVEGSVTDSTNDNVDETEAEDCVMDQPLVYEDSEEDKIEWILQKPKLKSKAVQRRGTSKKDLSCKTEEINDFNKAIKKVQKRSWVWKYFSKQGDVIYQCNLCRCNLSIKGCNTNNMNRHIRTKHCSIYNMEVETKPIVISESENGYKNEAEEIVVCNTYKPVVNSTEDDGSLFKQRWRSWVWLLFEQVSPTVARCKLCNRKITHGGTATGNLNRHIKLLHKEVYVEVCSSEKMNRRSNKIATSPEGEIALDIEDVNNFEEAWESFQCKEIMRRKSLCE